MKNNKFMLVCNILLLLVLLACNNKSKHVLVGIWEIHYPDIARLDTLVIEEIQDNLLSIKFIDKNLSYPPKFMKIQFDGKELKYETHQGKSINYNVFRLSEDKKKMKGVIYTWKKELKEVTLVKR